MIYTEISDEYAFWQWLGTAGSYKDQFSLEGAKALQAYFEELSAELNENISFDPVAWCVEFSEHDTALEAYNEYHGKDDEGVGTAIGDDNTAENAEAQALEWLQDQTTVIELDNGHIILGEF